MAACPSCAAPLDPEGICTACGALSRGFFRGLDLGPPQVAAAVARGLDFYRLLDVPPDADTRAIARRYRRLRALFPDDPRRLAAEPARKLELLELAGRVLTDPALRQVYAELRAGGPARAELGVLRCTTCGAPLEQGAAQCVYCGTPRPAVAQAPAAPPEEGPPPIEPVDYYAVLGLQAEHLQRAPAAPPRAGLYAMGSDPRLMPGDLAAQFVRPPTPEEVDEAAYTRQRSVLTAAGLPADERERRYRELELARRVLRDDRRRGQYDGLLSAFLRGQYDRTRLEALHQLEEGVLAELREEQGQPASQEQAGALLRQARGYLDAGMPREALPLLRRVLAAAPRDAHAHAAFAEAALLSNDPLSLGGHLLRQVLASIDAAAAGGQPIADGPALAALCRGLIAREEGRADDAEALLREAARLNRALGPAWRGLAALALARGDHAGAIEQARQALAADRNDEHALLLIAAACLRLRRRDQAGEAAAQIARIRGAGWSADAVLREIAG